MRDERPGQPEDTRIALEGTTGQFRQLSVIAGWQVVADLTQLFVHDVKVVTSHSAAGVMAPSSRMALAIVRYEASSTRALSSTRGSSGRPACEVVVTA
jgi:hypothetical protein